MPVQTTSVNTKLMVFDLQNIQTCFSERNRLSQVVAELEGT